MNDECMLYLVCHVNQWTISWRKSSGTQSQEGDYTDHTNQHALIVQSARTKEKEREREATNQPESTNLERGNTKLGVTELDGLDLLPLIRK